VHGVTCRRHIDRRMRRKNIACDGRGKSWRASASDWPAMYRAFIAQQSDPLPWIPRADDDDVASCWNSPLN